MAATTDRRLDAPAEGPGPDDIEPVLHETRDRIITGTVTIVPFLLLAVVAWQLWNNLLHWHDLAVFAILYAASGLGITVGFHRLFTHRSFKTSPALRGVFAACGSIAIEGPVISWVADHRKHHAFSDQPGDPHSPHVDHGGGWRGARCAGVSVRRRDIAPRRQGMGPDARIHSGWFTTHRTEEAWQQRPTGGSTPRRKALARTTSSRSCTRRATASSPAPSWWCRS